MRAAAFLGRPNSGKSSLFNALTGADAHIGNFPGITVDVLEAKATLPSSGEAIVLYDLPGLYSLDPRLEVGSDERVARDFLDERARAGDSLVLVQVIDANQLALGLRLTRDLQKNEAELPVLVVVTQTDVLAKDGKEVDTDALTAALGCPFVATHARASDCREVVLGAIARAHTMTGPSSSSTSSTSSTSSASEHDAWEPDALAASALRVRAPAPGETPQRTSRERTERVDRVLLHPVFGLPIFVLIMAGLFATVFLIADPATDLADAAMRALGQLLRRGLGEGLFASLVVDGVLGGVGTVLAFLPQILLLIALMDVLEATGYLARAAFLVDRLFRAFGLGGKSFVPLLTGHACAVPAISATRIIRDPRERLTTILVIPLMTCSARLPVYTLVVATFFGGSAFTRAAVTTGLYFGGIASGLVAALVIRRTVVRGKGLPLLLEMPAYRAPVLRSLLRRCWLEATDFLRRAGTIILASAVALWILLNIPVRGASAPDEPLIERSAAAAMGRALEPVTRPLGFDWRINVGLIGSFGARELMVGTMGVIFGVEGADKEPAPLVEKIRAARRPDGAPSYDRPAAVALLVFFVIACQCMSTLAAIRRETRGWKMPAFVLAYSYVVAWVLAAGAHRIAAIWWLHLATLRSRCGQQCASQRFRRVATLTSLLQRADRRITGERASKACGPDHASYDFVRRFLRAAATWGVLSLACGSSADKATSSIDDPAGAAGGSAAGNGQGASSGQGASAGSGSGGASGGGAGSTSGKGGNAGVGSSGKGGTGTGTGGTGTAGTGTGGMGTAGTGTGGTGTGGTGTGGAPPQIAACPAQVAFVASKLTASAPTPDGLVAALGTLLSSPKGALGVVLRNVKTPAPSIAASALDPSKSPLAFDSAHGPSGFSSATFADLAVQNEIPQATGAVRIVDGAGNVVFLPLEELRIQILPDATCGSVTGFVTANIPTSSGSTKLVVDGATKTLLDLAGPPGGGGQGMALYWQLRLELTAAAAPFDFSTLPP